MLTSRSRGWWLRAAGSAVFAGVLLAAACMEPRPTAPKPARVAEGERVANPEAGHGWLVGPGMPLAYHTNDDMILAALTRHAPSVLTQDMKVEAVHVWLLLDRQGRVEKTRISTTQPTGGTGTMTGALLEPFPGEKMSSFERVGATGYKAGLIGPNAVRVWWLERNAEVTPHPALGIYEFDAQRAVPSRAIVEAAVQKYFPDFAKVGLTEETPVGQPARGAIPWFIVDAGGEIVWSWMDTPVWNGILARKRIEEKFPRMRFSSVQSAAVRTARGSQPPVVWATLAEGAGGR
jgi:hypothetical protein